MNKIISKLNKNIIFIFVAIGLGIIIGLALGSKNNKQIEKKGTTIKQKKTTIWTCSMHPQIRSNKPGKCPICGMKLIPVDQLSQNIKENSNPNEIQLTESAIQLANIQTYTIKKIKSLHLIYVYGQVKTAETNVKQITARFAGRIEKLFANFTGQKIIKGQKIASIYSPQLITAQKELLEAAKYKNQNPSLYKSAKNKLLLWNLSSEQIKKIEKNGKPIEIFDILAPMSGTILNKYINEGDYVQTGSKLFRIANLNTVWIMLDIYENDLPLVSIGNTVIIKSKALPRKTFIGKISFIDPVLNPQTRTAQARIILKNNNQLLKPGMFVNGIIKISMTDQNSILIPKTAVLWTGKRSIVYVKLKNRNKPSFIMRQISLGPDLGNYYIVEKGLKIDEQIVTYGVFKIDAAAQLQGKTSMMNPIQNSINKNFSKQIDNLVKNYINLKNAFVESNENSINKTTKKTLQALEQCNNNPFIENINDQWSIFYNNIKTNLIGIMKMKGLEMKRKHFSIISLNLAKVIEKFGIIDSNKFYYEYCPMAFNNKGAYWISEIKKIRNPYFGEKMLSCGEVKKIFHSKNVKK
jgi:Cu(I)/Ag(I) efflux system membrane fusion protein